jgi:hypothetical protein
MGGSCGSAVPRPRDRRLGAAFQLGPHRQRPPGYGEPAQPRHRHPASPRPPQHRHRPASERPRRHPIPRPPRHHNPMNRHSRTLPTPCGVRRGALAMASPWLSLYPFAVPARRPRGRSAAYSWRCCRGRAGHLPGRPGDGERRKRSVTALSAFGRGAGASSAGGGSWRSTRSSQSEGLAVSQARSSRRRILPVTVLGRSSTSSTARGYL